MAPKLADVLNRVQAWPDEAQQELARLAEEIELGLKRTYRATTEELAALDAAEASGLASPAEVEVAFGQFRAR